MQECKSSIVTVTVQSNVEGRKESDRKSACLSVCILLYCDAKPSGLMLRLKKGGEHCDGYFIKYKTRQLAT